MIELLSTIVILAIVTLIATPIVLNIVEKVKLSSKGLMANNIISAYEQYTQMAQITNKTVKTNLNYLSGSEIKDLIGLKGNIPNIFNTLKLDEDGNVLIYFNEDNISCWNYGNKDNVPDNTNYDLIELTCKANLQIEEQGDYIRVKDGRLYNLTQNTPFQMIGINFDNNTWNPEISTGNTGHDQTSYAEIAAMGFNTIRFGLAFNMTLADDFFEWLDINIKQAEEAGLKIELDMHTSQAGIQIRDKESTYQFWQSEELQQEFIETWVKIAEHYKNNNVIIYDLLNEPLVIVNDGQDPNELYYKFMEKLINAIRKVDNKKIICVESYSSMLSTSDVETNEITYASMTSTGQEVVKRLTDDNLIYDVHNYGPTDYTYQTDDNHLAYDDVFKEQGRESWGNGSGYIYVKTNEVDKWVLFESDLYQMNDEDVNYGNISYIYDKEPEGSTLYINNIVVEEYDENKQYVRDVYEFSFNKSKYNWSAYGIQQYEISDSGYDDIGGALKLTSIGTSGYLTLRIHNTDYSIKSGYYYKIKFYMKSSTVLDTNHARVTLMAAKAEFVGGLKGLADYNFKKYEDFSIENKIPMICNEFGTNYNSIKNSNGGQYLYDIMNAVYRYNTNISLFSYSGFDFGLMYDSSRNFGTDKSKLRQDSYDAIYKAINQDSSYSHIFKNNITLQQYSGCKIGETVLVLGKDYAGVGEKLEYIITDENKNNNIELSNGLYAKLIKKIK